MAAANVTGPWKFASLGGGVLAGVGLTAGLHKLLPEPDRASELKKDGMPVLDSRTASVFGITAPFGFAGGVALGLQKRVPGAGLSTLSQILAVALLSSATSMMVSADTDRAGKNVTGISMMMASVGAGALVGVRQGIPEIRAKHIGLAAFGMAIGGAAPFVADVFGRVPEQVGNSFRHRER